MAGLSALWMPIVVSVVFVFVALMLIHGLVGWHKGDMIAVPDEAKVMETLRALKLQPGEYRFPYSNSTKEMTGPEFVEKMNQGPVGVMTIRPSGELNMGKMLGQWLVYSIFIATLAAYMTCVTLGLGARHIDVFLIGGGITFCCYVVALWHNWIWWGQSTRFTLTYSLDGLIYALITGATFGWLWPH